MLQMLLRSIGTFLLVLGGTLLIGCSSSSSTRSTASVKTRNVLDRALSLTGTAYCPAGSTPDCFDCSGFVSYCFLTTDIVLPRTSQDMSLVGDAIDKGALRQGDLVFFTTGGAGVNHVGLMVDDARFIHSSTSKGVIISPLADPYWSKRFVGARRVFH